MSVANRWNLCIGVLGLAPYKQVRFHRYPGGVFVGHRHPGTPVAPCFIKRREERKRKKEKFYIYLDVTHTHTVFGWWHPIKFLLFRVFQLVVIPPQCLPILSHYLPIASRLSHYIPIISIRIQSHYIPLYQYPTLMIQSHYIMDQYPH